MCLSTVTKRFEGVGYKVFNWSKRKHHFEFCKLNGRSTVLKDRWLIANDGFRITTIEDRQTYSRGFHIFKFKKDGISYKGPEQRILKVRYRFPICEGRQGSHEIIVAKEIYVSSKAKNER